MRIFLDCSNSDWTMGNRTRIGKPTTGHTIPRPPKPQAPAPSPARAPQPGFNLDMNQVQAKIRDTAEVAELLEGIFNTEPEVTYTAVPPTHVSTQAAAAPLLSGLDQAHSNLVRELQGLEALPREAFEKLALAQNLLPDGALDRINEASFEVADAPLLEGENPILVARDVLAEILT